MGFQGQILASAFDFVPNSLDFFFFFITLGLEMSDTAHNDAILRLFMWTDSGMFRDEIRGVLDLPDSG